jgi:hypothetical protein
LQQNWAREPTAHASKQLGLALNRKLTIFWKGAVTRSWTMMATFDKPSKEANGCQRKCGKDMPPRLLGYFPCVLVGRRTINMSELNKELRTWNAAFVLTLKATNKCDLLKKDEAHHQEEQVDADLTAQGYQFHGL